MDIKIFRISSLRVIDLAKKVDTLNESQKQSAKRKYEEKLSQYFVKVTYKNGMYVVEDNYDYYYVCKEMKQGIINVGINISELEHIKSHLLYRSQNEILNPMISALIFQELAEINKLGQKEISQAIGKSQGAISNKKRLLKLPVFVQNELIKGTIKERHGRAILQLSKLENYEELAKEVLITILKEKLNVSQATDLINEKLGKPKTKQKQELNIKAVTEISSLKRPESKMIINYLKKELEGATSSVEKNFPNLVLELEEGLNNDDYVFLLKMKGINK